MKAVMNRSKTRLYTVFVLSFTHDNSHKLPVLVIAFWGPALL